MASEPTTAPLPSQTELVIGLVGALGIDLEKSHTALAKVLSRFKYQCHNIRLSDQLREMDWTDVELVDEPADVRISSYMTAGNTLCERWGRDDAFGMLAVNAITRLREGATGDIDTPADRHAYVLRSLKRRDEAKLLRDVYRSRFVLLSLYTPKDQRVDQLDALIADSRTYPIDPTPVYAAADLVKRDENEAVKHGQDVRGIFHEGDFFVDVTNNLERELTRIIEILFGHPARTPTRDEMGMFHAVAAARRSAELGRQVGAAICTAEGSLVAVGANEVPQAGGGLYWEGDLGDAREFQTGRDTSDERKTNLILSVADLLIKNELTADGVDHDALADVLAVSRIDDLIEFVRAVHAEMAALTDAVARGISVKGGVLYVTTFPCHHCARHLVAAGIDRVVYVAPYPKSLAAELHGDAICVDPATPASAANKVVFKPFVGVGPRRFLDLFEMPQRKQDDGTLVPFDPEAAQPRIDEIDPEEMLSETQGYLYRERSALQLMARTMDRGAPRFSDYQPAEVGDRAAE